MKQGAGDRAGPWLISDPSMQGLHLNQEIGGLNFRRNNNTLLVDEGGGSLDPPTNYQSSAHLRKGSMQGIGPRSLLSQNGSTIIGAQSNLNVMYNGGQQPPMFPDNKVEIKSNFLRKGQGRGGSPTEYDVGFIDAQTGKRVSLN